MGQDGAALGRRDGSGAANTRGPLGPGQLGGLPARRQAVPGSWDRTARSWDLRTGAALQTLKGHLGSVSPIAQGGNSSPTLFILNN